MPIGLLTRLLIWIVLMLRMPVATASAASATAAFVARSFSGAIAGLALFDCG
jgi:hypothetical protein